jgi:hypothetical protein
MSSLDDQASNDYAVAKQLNDYAMTIISAVVIADLHDLPEDFNIKELNRAYILLVNELQTLYSRNAELADIKPEPVWKQFDVLKILTWAINDYANDDDSDAGQAHNARVEKLCILSGKETPDYTPEQKKLIDDTSATVTKYLRAIGRADEQNKAQKESERYIAEYTLTIKPDGTVLINDVLKLKKTQAASTTTRLLEQAVKRPDVLFMPNIGQTSRNLSTILSSSGFTKELRMLFFPTISTSKGIVFRPIVTREQAELDGIDTTELDHKLKAAGAVTQPAP